MNRCYIVYLSKATYEDLKISFLTDEDDTIAAYEERGKQMSTKSSYDKGLEALQSMNRVQQVELVHGKYHALCYFHLQRSSWYTVN